MKNLQLKLDKDYFWLNGFGLLSDFFHRFFHSHFKLFFRYTHIVTICIFLIWAYFNYLSSTAALFHIAFSVLQKEFESLLRFVLHPLILIPYSFFTYFYYNQFMSDGNEAKFLFFSAMILLWYTNETFTIRRNQDFEREEKIKKKFQK